MWIQFLFCQGQNYAVARPTIHIVHSFYLWMPFIFYRGDTDLPECIQIEQKLGQFTILHQLSNVQ